MLLTTKEFANSATKIIGLEIPLLIILKRMLFRNVYLEPIILTLIVKVSIYTQTVAKPVFPLSMFAKINAKFNQKE